MKLKTRTTAGAPHAKRHSTAFKVLVTAVAMSISLLFGIAGTAFANTANPVTVHSYYAVETNGAVHAWVDGTWTWGPEAVKNSPQSCTNVTSLGDVNGHYAVGLAVDWNDATTPYVVNGGPAAPAGPGVSGAKGTSTFHVGSAMDWSVVDYCPNGSNPNTYPGGTFSTASTPHTYASLAVFNQDTDNGQLCVNMYDIHQKNNANDWNPSKNGDNSIQSNEYVNAANCSTAQIATPTAQSPTIKPGLSIVKTERVGSSGTFVRGPVSAAIGEQLQYQIVVTDTGNTSLTVTLSDPRCDVGTISPVGTQTIAAGSSLTYTCSHVLVALPNSHRFGNVATATGVTPQDTPVGPAKSRVFATLHAPVLHVKTLTPAKPAHPVLKTATFTG